MQLWVCIGDEGGRLDTNARDGLCGGGHEGYVGGFGLCRGRLDAHGCVVTGFGFWCALTKGVAVDRCVVGMSLGHGTGRQADMDTVLVNVS